MIRLLVFLESAWSPTWAGREWPRNAWLHALTRSRSGSMLRTLLRGQGLDACWSTSPKVAPTPDEVTEPDREHIVKLLKRHKPKLVVACGHQAERALLRLWPGSLLVIPHPSCDVLAEDLYEAARGLILSGQMRGGRRLAIVQLEDGIELVELPGSCRDFCPFCASRFAGAAALGIHCAECFRASEAERSFFAARGYWPGDLTGQGVTGRPGRLRVIGLETGRRAP